MSSRISKRSRSSVAFTARSSTLILDAGDLVIDSVRDGGRPLRFARRAAELQIELGRGAPGGERAVDIEYHGTPRRGLSFVPDGNQVSASFATSQWLPVVDDPSERATFDLTLAVPTALRLRETASGAANESKLSLETGRTRTRWVLDRPRRRIW